MKIRPKYHDTLHRIRDHEIIDMINDTCNRLFREILTTELVRTDKGKLKIFLKYRDEGSGFTTYDLIEELLIDLQEKGLIK